LLSHINGWLGICEAGLAKYYEGFVHRNTEHTGDSVYMVYSRRLPVAGEEERATLDTRFVWKGLVPLLLEGCSFRNESGSFLDWNIEWIFLTTASRGRWRDVKVGV
jgi:hypothetical protein